MGHDTHDDHGDGLHEDLVRLASRRDALRILGAGGAAAILSTLGASKALAAPPTAAVPTETAGPYPGDGSNGPDVLDDSGASVTVRLTLRGTPLASVRRLPKLRRMSWRTMALSTDNVFGDDKAIHQLATVTGSVGRGYVANLTIGV